MARPKVEVYEREDGGFDWRLIGGNSEQMCESSQGYTERNDAHEGFARTYGLLGGTARTRVVDLDREGLPLDRTREE